MEWQDARGLAVTDPGGDRSGLSEVRTRWVRGSATDWQRAASAAAVGHARGAAGATRGRAPPAGWDGPWVGDAEHGRWRTAAELPPAAEQVESPYAPEARGGIERRLNGVGSKGPVTETCDDDGPHLLTPVATTVSPVPAVAQRAAIQPGLAETALLPARHGVAAGSVRASECVTREQAPQGALVGPIYAARQGHAQAQTGVDVAPLQVNWDAASVTCPAGRTRVRWRPTETVMACHPGSPSWLYRPRFRGQSADDNHAAISEANAARTAAGERWPCRASSHSRL